MARTRAGNGKAAQPSAAARAAAPSSKKQRQGGRQRPTGTVAGGSGGQARARRLRSRIPAPPVRTDRIVEYAPMPSPSTLAERFALLGKQRQQLGVARQRAAAVALGIASGGVAKKKKQKQRLRKARVGDLVCRDGQCAGIVLDWKATAFMSLHMMYGKPPCVLPLSPAHNNAHPILPALQAATSKAAGASSKPAAAKAAAAKVQSKAAADASGAGSSGKKRRRGSRRAKGAGQAMDTVSVTAQLP